MHESIIAVLYFIAVVASIFLGLRMDKTLKIAHPDVNPYAFGYFLGFLGVLSFPIFLLGYYYLPSVMESPNLTIEFAFTLTAIGILYRRILAWILFITGNIAYAMSFIFTPSMLHKPLESLKSLVIQQFASGEMWVTVAIIIILTVILTYYLKRRHELPFP